MEKFRDILDIARENIRQNPSLQGRSAEDVALQYLKGLQDEVAEVTEEVREHNRVHLEDELSDIAWDYACVLAKLEQDGYIDSAEAVITHGLNKYSERAPAFLEASEEMWDAVKTKQKTDLKTRHEELYGN
jgi:NTP pyrophosphatase (non-canonical NTP hydrolase)